MNEYRLELVKAAMQALLSRENLIDEASCARLAVSYADAALSAMDQTPEPKKKDRVAL